MKTKIYLLIFLFPLWGLGGFSLQAQTSTIRYVKDGGTPAAQAAAATTWGAACADLQAVINASAAGDSVFVASGTYTGGFFMRDGVQVYGGFAGMEANTHARTGGIFSAPTILDGGGAQRVLTQPRAFANPTVWDGFVLQNGRVGTDNLYTGMLVFGNNNQPAGLLTYRRSDDNSWRVLSLVETSGKWSTEYVSTDATNQNAGVPNMLKIKAIFGWESKYPLFYWADTLTAGGFTDWYLPSVQELGVYWGLYTKKDSLNSVLSAIGRQTLNAWYWSGSESGPGYGVNYALGVNFSNGNVTNYDKVYGNLSARAFSAFNSFNNLNTLTFCGGAVLLQGNGILRWCVVTGSAASGQGGGVYAGAGAQVQGCLVNGNTAPGAPGVYAAAGSTVTSSTIVNNMQTVTPQPATLPQIGDYYYTDGSYSTSAGSATPFVNKELVGIVCYLNPTNPRSGLVLNLSESGYDSWYNQDNWVKALTTAGRTWRLPTVDELQWIYGGNPGVTQVPANYRDKINTALSAAGGTQLSNASYYWSGSEVAALGAWGVDFGSGYVGGVNKVIGGGSARAVLVF